MTGDPERWDELEDLEPWEKAAAKVNDNIWTRPLGRPEYPWEDIRDPRPERLEELRSMPYRDYLLTPEWQQRRLAALSSAREKCEHCGRKRHLHVHHLTYENRGCEKPFDLMVLCATCHREVHEAA